MVDWATPFLTDDFDFFVRCSLRCALPPGPNRRCAIGCTGRSSSSGDETLLNGFRYRVRLLDELSVRPGMQERWSIDKTGAAPVGRNGWKRPGEHAIWGG